MPPWYAPAWLVVPKPEPSERVSPNAHVRRYSPLRRSGLTPPENELVEDALTSLLPVGQLAREDGGCMAKLVVYGRPTLVWTKTPPTVPGSETVTTSAVDVMRKESVSNAHVPPILV